MSELENRRELEETIAAGGNVAEDSSEDSLEADQSDELEEVDHDQKCRPVDNFVVIFCVFEM